MCRRGRFGNKFQKAKQYFCNFPRILNSIRQVSGVLSEICCFRKRKTLGDKMQEQFSKRLVTLYIFRTRTLGCKQKTEQKD